MKSTVHSRAFLLGTSVLAGVGLLLAATPAVAQDTVETVTVTGYRASLESSANAKRASVGFSDAVFAEDIGKFPDTNIAESLNRIPGVTISREVNGEGVNVQIRGLGTNFTKILLNGNPIAVATTGGTDSANNNREVDLNMFPTDLFTQLTVAKSPMADQIEGGAAGTITMRSMRPFDKPGFRVVYNAQLSDQSTTEMAIGKRGTIMVSDTEGPFGVLFGISGVQSNQLVKGWEDGNAGWNTSNLPGTSPISTGGTNGGTCGVVTTKKSDGSTTTTPNTCNQFGGSAWTIQPTIPAGVFVPVPNGFALTGGASPNVVNGVAYLPTGYALDQRTLYALNPGLADSTCSQTAPSEACLNQMSTRLSNAMLPRLGRPMFEKGTRDRYNAVLSLEFRPSDDLHFYFDTIFGRSFNNLNRSDIDWGVRGGASSTNMIPANLKLSPAWVNDANTSGLGGVVQSGTFYNAVYGLEARPYREKSDFISLNPGMSWQATDLLKIDWQANYSRSHFFRQSPTVMVTTCTATPPAAGIDNCPNGAPSLGTVLNFSNAVSGQPPVQSINLDLNDPKNYEWNLGRVNLQAEKRYTYTLGTHLDTTYGGDKFAVKAGFAYDETYRLISAIQDDTLWQNNICGNNPNVYLPGPNSNMPSCTGQNTTTTPAGYTMPSYPGYGTGWSTGFPALAFRGSTVPTSQLVNYLMPGPNGFVTVNYDKIFGASNYYQVLNNALGEIHCVPNCNIRKGAFWGNANTGGGTGGFDEKTVGLYAKFVGTIDIGERRLKYDAGLRWVETHQTIITPIETTDPRNASLKDGGLYPNYFTFTKTKGTYQAFLPSFSAAYEVTDDFQVRVAFSRTMNRPNPADLVGALVFSDQNVSSATLGNPNLKPYYSNNIDLGAELYTGGEGYIGFTMFRKSISGFTNQIQTLRNFAWLGQYGITWSSLGQSQQQNYMLNGGPTGIPCNSDATCANQPVYVTQRVNLKGLEIINGLEVDYVQPLDFLTEQYFGIKGFGFNGNLTIIDQKSTGSVPAIATGVAPFQYNVTGYYEDNGVMLRLSYNWNDRVYIGNNNSYECFPVAQNGVQPKGCPTGPFLMGQPYGQADFASSVKLSKLFGELPSDPELTFDVQNVFSAKSKSYIYMQDAIHSYYIKGQTYMVGLRGSF